MATPSTSSSSTSKLTKATVSMGTYKTSKPYPWKWDPTVLLHGPPGGASGRSEYGDSSLIQLGRRKQATIVTPEMIREFTSQTLVQLGLDPMYPAALCQLVRAQGPKQRGQDHLSVILASLGRFRDPMTSDPGGQLYRSTVEEWESPAKLSRRTASAPGMTMQEVCSVPDKDGCKGPLTPAELAILDELVIRWKTLVPFADEDEMAHYLLEPSTFDQSRNDRPLVEALLVTIFGYRTGRMWITIDDSHTVSRARQHLENELQRAILEGKAFRQSRFADGSLYRASRARTRNFATDAEERRKLLGAYRDVTQSPDATFDMMRFDIIDQMNGKRNEVSAFFNGLAWSYNPVCTNNERSNGITEMKKWAKNDQLGQVQYHSWTPREDLYLFKACFELGFADHAVIAEALRVHGMNPSLIAVTWRVSRRGSIAIPAVDRLRRSCPRWWKAMGLPATGKDALAETVVRGMASGASIGDDDAENKAYEGIDQALFDEDLAATYFPTDAELPGSHAGFESYLRRDVLESDKTQAELLRVAVTKTAILRRWSERLIEEQMAQAAQPSPAGHPI